MCEHLGGAVDGVKHLLAILVFHKQLHTPDGFRCIEYAPGVTIDEIKAKTAGRLAIADNVKEMVF